MKDLILSRIDTARLALMQCRTAMDAKKVSDIAKAAEVYARRQKASKETVQYAHEVHVEAMTMLGEFLAKAEKKHGGHAQRTRLQKSTESPASLADLGVSKRESSDGQLLAAASKSPELKALYAEVKTGRKSVRHIRREIKRVEHRSRVRTAQKNPSEVSDGPYGLILADPPWKYDWNEAENREIENHYGTATIEDIFDHKPSCLPDSILFLWATAPKLSEALEVMNEWGFSYRSCAVWDKEKIGMGYWWRIQHELLLVGVRGSPGCTPESERISSIFHEPRGKHSVKPKSVYEWIERSFPSLSKLEMYCRKPRPGWAAWGNEV